MYDHLLHTADVALSLIQCCASMQQQTTSSAGNIMGNCQETKYIPSVHSSTNVAVAFSSKPAEPTKITNDSLDGSAIASSQSLFAPTRSNNSSRLAGGQCRQRFKGAQNRYIVPCQNDPKEASAFELDARILHIMRPRDPKTHN